MKWYFAVAAGVFGATFGSGAFAQVASSPASIGSGWLTPEANQCLAEKAATSLLDACPANIQAKVHKKGTAQFLEGEEKKIETHKDVHTASKEVTPEREKPAVSNASKAKLLQEIQQLEDQLKDLKARTPDWLKSKRRLAEDYYEFEHLVAEDAVKVLGQKAGCAKNSSDPNCSSYDSKYKTLIRQRDGAQDEVVKNYQEIVDTYKADEYKLRDEVIYFLAFEFESRKAADDSTEERKKEADGKAKAIEKYRQLYKEHPKSKYVVAAYVAFGDMYFDEAVQGKADWAVPEAAYQRVLQAGEPPENKHYGYALYKLGFIYWNQAKFNLSLEHFRKAIEYGEKFASIPKATTLAREARKEIIPVFAESKKGADAYRYLHPLSGDKEGSNTETISMMERLGEEYLGRAHPDDARILFTDLKQRNPPNGCFYETRITEAVITKNPKDKEAILNQLKNLSQTWLSYNASGASAEGKQSCGGATAWLLADYAILWEYEGVGDMGCPIDESLKGNKDLHQGTCNPKTLDVATAALELAIDTFGRDPATPGKMVDHFKNYKFPTKPGKEPTLQKLLLYRADLLFSRQKWSKEDPKDPKKKIPYCGPAFDEVVDFDPNSEVAGDAAFAAVLCYQNYYDEIYKGGEDKKEAKNTSKLGSQKKPEEENFKAMNIPKPMSSAQSSMFGAFTRFVCYIKPEQGSKSYKDDMDRLVEVKYRRAFLLYESQHWDEAAVAFRQIAYDYIDHEQAVIAAKMYFDAEARVLQYSDPERPACRANMYDDVEKLRNNFCDEKKVTERLKGDKKKAEEFLQSSEGLCQSLKGAYSYLKAQKLLQCVKDAAASNQPSRFGECAKGFEDLGYEVCEAEKSLIGHSGGPSANARGPAARGPAPARGPAAAKDKKAAPVADESNCSRDGSVFFYNAAMYYQKASKIKSAMDLRRKILDTDMWREKETYRLTLFDLADDYRRIALYGLAADYYERYSEKKAVVKELADLVPGAKLQELQAKYGKDEAGKERTKDQVLIEWVDEQRSESLMDAVILRLGLGNEDAAIKDSNTFDSQFGKKRKEQARQIVVAIGEHYINQSEWQKGITRFEQFLKDYSADARIDETFHARALIGRAHRALNHGKAAEPHFTKILADWRASRDDILKKTQQVAQDKHNSGLLANVLGAVAESYLYFADFELDKAKAIPFQQYQPSTIHCEKPENFQKCQDYFDDYFKKKFVDYLVKRSAANKVAAEAFGRVLCLGEDTRRESQGGTCSESWRTLAENYAPRFVVEASSKGGDLFAETYDRAYNAPLGPMLEIFKTDDSVTKAMKISMQRLYRQRLDEVASNPLRKPARAAFVECLKVSTRAKFFDNYSERCEQWLNKVDPTSFRTLDEVRPSGGLIDGGLKDRPFLMDSKLVPFDVVGQK